MSKTPKEVYDGILAGKYKGRDGEALFKEDALSACGIDGRDDAFRFAWDYGHSAGYGEVLMILEDVAALIKGPAAKQAPNEAKLSISLNEAEELLQLLPKLHELFEYAHSRGIISRIRTFVHS